MRKCIIAGLLLLAGSPVFALQPETIDYTNRCGVALDSGYVEAVDRFIQAGKQSGWWYKLIAVNFFCAPNQTAALVNAKTNTFGLKNVNGVTHTPYEGFRGNGTSSYLEMSNTPSSLASAGFTTTSHSVFVFSQTDNRSIGVDAGMMGPGTIAIGVQACSTNDLTRIWAGTNRTVGALWITNNPATAKGLTGVVRSSAAGGFAVRNAGFKTFYEDSASALPTSAFRYFRLGSQAYYSSNQLAIGLVGTGEITLGQTEDIYYRCVELLCALGTWSELDNSMANYLGRVSASETWDGQFIVAANNFIKRGKDNGNWWNKMKAVYFFCAPSSNGAVVNAKGTNYNLTVNGGITFTPQGAQGNGANGYLDTCAKISGLGLSMTGHSMFVYCQSDNATLGGEVGAMGPITSTVGIRVHYLSQCSIWSGPSAADWFGVESGYGLSGFVRNSTSGGFMVKNDVTDLLVLETAPEPTSTVRFFRLGTSANYSKNKLAFGLIGDHTVTSNNAVDIYQACTEMLVNAGSNRWVDPPEPDSAEPPHAFARDSLPSGLNVFRWAAPPASNGLNFIGNPPNYTNGGYAYGPISDAITRPWNGTTWSSTDTQVGRWELLWSNRKMDEWNSKPNYGFGGIFNSAGEECRAEYTTYSNAVGATLVQAAYTVGMKYSNDPDYGGRGWGDIAKDWGYDMSYWDAQWTNNPANPIFTNNECFAMGPIAHYAYAATNADTYFPYLSESFKVCRNKILLQQKRLCDIPLQSMVRGIVLDHEHCDDRPADLQLDSMIELSRIVKSKGYKLAAWGQGVTSVSGQHSGWTITNAWQILTNLEWFVIEVQARDNDPEAVQQDMQEQFDYFKGPNGDKAVPVKRLCMQIAVGDAGKEMTTNEVLVARSFMLSKGITNVHFPNFYVTWGGDISRTPNQNLATFLGLPTQ